MDKEAYFSDGQKNPTPAGPLLFVFPDRKYAQLVWPAPQDDNLQLADIKLNLPEQFTKLVCLMQRAFNQDEGLPDDLRGFRSADVLAKGLSEDGYEPEAKTVTAYLCRLNKKFRKATPAGCATPPFLIRTPRRGAKLAVPITIVPVGNWTDAA